jgi:hypothetical protein
VQSGKPMSHIAAPLEQALAPAPAEAPPIWIARMDRALAGVEQAASGRRSSFAKENKLSEVSDLIPSPGLDRRLGRLRQELGTLVEEAGAIREAMRQEVEKPRVAAASLRRFHRRAARLLLGLEQYELEEGRLLLDSVNTDIGAGD